MTNGSWTGIMGELTSGRADLALFPLTMTAQRAAAVSYTIPFMSDGYGLVVQQQQVGHRTPACRVKFLPVPPVHTTTRAVTAVLVQPVVVIQHEVLSPRQVELGNSCHHSAACFLSESEQKMGGAYTYFQSKT